MRKLFFLSFFLSLTLISCNKEDDIVKQENPINNYPREGLIKLGKKLNDPFAIENIRKAYASLKAKKEEVPDIEIQPTHTYVRFLPESEQQLDEVKNDTSLVLFDYPLDVEIEEGGTYYHDPSLPDSVITWQYCVIPYKSTIPTVKTEKIYDAFIPSTFDVYIDTLEEVDSKNSKLLEFYDKLIYESARLTGNLPDSVDETKGWLFPSKWRPKGTIKVWDDVKKGYIPLVGARVHARWFLHIETDVTDQNGYFETSRFRYEVNYAIKWERARYDIRNGWIWQAWYNGPKKKGDWNLNIDGGKSLMYASIHRAAHRHYYGNNLGMLRPITVQKICYIDEKGDRINGDYWSWTSALPPVFPTIRVYGYNSSGKRSTQEVFSTTAHELAHAAHLNNMGNIQFWQVSNNIVESWAEAVEWALTLQEYSDFGIALPLSISNLLNKQSEWPDAYNKKEYSPLFIDLVDDYNQYLIFGGNCPNDNVKGYTMPLLSSILLKSYGLSSLKSELKSKKPIGVTNEQIDLLFNKFEEVMK